MGKESNIVHQYFKKEAEGIKILVRVNPIHLKGTEIVVEKETVEIRDLEFDSGIFEDLAVDGFVEVNALEFNLYLSGLV
ncbi:MAG: hypothetical protein KBF45_10390 [Cyclobacteriaceae bacterium]|jgi:hypothetical protein|nr:hypothetical protein [Cyclobacteriaceae bacterium]